MKKILFLSLYLFILSCTRNNEDLQTQENVGTHLVSKSQIQKILSSNSYNKNFSKSRKTGRVINKVVKDFQTIESKGNAVYYIANYEGGGYVIISADDRIDPILALSEDNTFDFNSAKTQNGIGLWLNLQSEVINSIRDENLTQTDEVENAWDNLVSSAPPDPTSGSTTTYITALTPTTWGQGTFYNDYTPIGSCGSHTLTGCVATAMAQVIKYNQYSSVNNYNWSLMPNDFGTSETSRLMHDAGLSVNMQYGCESSGAQTSAITNGFAHFGYTNVQKTSNLITNWITNDLALNKPVILCGGSSNNGHAWVCDGSWTHTEWDESGGWSSQLFHMNWGWNGSYNDYYSLASLNPAGYNFSSNLVLFYNLYQLPI